MDNLIHADKRWLLIGLGFIFRSYITILLFWKGFQSLAHGAYYRPSVTLLARLIGIGFIFLSIHLFLNLRLKKVSQEAYYAWGISISLVFVISLILYLLDFSDSETIRTLEMLKWLFTL